MREKTHTKDEICTQIGAFNLFNLTYPHGVSWVLLIGLKKTTRESRDSDFWKRANCFKNHLLKNNVLVSANFLGFVRSYEDN